VLFAISLTLSAADTDRLADVRERGALVMPFSLPATTHIFSKVEDGGVQQVIAKDPGDAGQITLIRAHLHHMQLRFSQGDFSGPTTIHGAAMPGLGALKSAPPGRIAIDYVDIEGGAELRYRTADPALVLALHDWLDAQLSDHGHDAMVGHHHPPLNRPLQP
jgi:hypothetical protein